MVEGVAGSADCCMASIEQFFKKCKQDNGWPIIYYAGHGDTDGDWIFPEGYISFAKLKKLHDDILETGDCLPNWTPRIYSDCCYSGNWARHGVTHGWHVV